MKKFMLIILVLLVIQKKDEIRRFLDPPPDNAGMQGAPIVMYSAEWCGYCDKARDLMDENDIAYYEYDIDKSDDARREYESYGGRVVPLMLIDGEVIKGYHPDKILGYQQ